MSLLVNAHLISKSFGHRPLFEKISFSISTLDRIGLIGPNGAGKSTLLKILSGVGHVDDGTLSFQKNMRLSLLEQTPQFQENATVMSTVLEKSNEQDHHDDWEITARAQEMLAQFGLHPSEGIYPETKVATLSGGWKKRLALARELFRPPDLLLLDEPTNHLDLKSIFWLEQFLARAPFACMTITHDRAFLQKISNRIIELDPRHTDGLLSVKGGYLEYLEIKNNLMHAQEQQETKLKNTLRRETEWLLQGAKARTTKQQARIQQAGELKSKVQDLAIRNQQHKVEVSFTYQEKAPKKLIEAKNIAKSFNGKKIIPPMNLIIPYGMRLGILGENGRGKSTLLQMLVGTLTPDQGSVTHAERLKISYFQQNRDDLNTDTTVLRSICPTGEFVEVAGKRIHVSAHLRKFLFKDHQFDQPVSKLSGGEQSRLLIAKLMMTEANLLVLDEPTNDLDIATLNVLEEALLEFPGAILLVTHDRYFLDQVANKILSIDDQQNIEFFENLAQWEEWFETTKNGTSVPSTVSKIAENRTTKKNKLSYKEQKELESIEAVIKKTEEFLEQLTQESTKSENFSQGQKIKELTQKMSETQKKIDTLYQRWQDLEAKK